MNGRGQGQVESGQGQSGRGQPDRGKDKGGLAKSKDQYSFAEDDLMDNKDDQAKENPSEDKCGVDWVFNNTIED